MSLQILVRGHGNYSERSRSLHQAIACTLSFEVIFRFGQGERGGFASSAMTFSEKPTGVLIPGARGGPAQGHFGHPSNGGFHPFDP